MKEDETMSLRYDGIYYCKGWEENDFFRFYPDGTFVTKNIMNYETDDDNEIPFRFYPDGTFVTKNIMNYETDDDNEIPFPDVENANREPMQNYQCSGTYRIKQKTISFVLKFPYGTISYWGKIEENKLILNYYRKIPNEPFLPSGTWEFSFRPDTIDHLRFDGVYRFWKPNDCNDLFRFYPDGTVIRASFGCGFGESGETVPPVAKRWCTKERNQNQGKYQLHGSLITFETDGEFGKVFFQGRILQDAIVMDSYSHINQIERIGEKYEFVPD